MTRRDPSRTWGKWRPDPRAGPGWTYRPDERPPSTFGDHQPGVMTPHLRHALLTAYDLAGANPRALLERWTEQA